MSTRWLPLVLCGLLYAAIIGLLDMTPHEDAQAATALAAEQATEKSPSAGATAGAVPDEKPDANKGTADAGGKEAAHEHDPWLAAWENQQQYLQEVIDETAALRRDAPDLASNVSRRVAPFEQRLHQDFAMGTAYGKDPRVLEAVGRRIMDTSEAIRQVMAPAMEAQEQARKLLKILEQLKRTIPVNTGNDKLSSADMRKRFNILEQNYKYLQEVDNRLESAMTQGRMLLDRATAVLDDVDKYLPKLWIRQYFVAPIRYVEAKLWEDMSGQLAAMTTTFVLRLSMELPQGEAAWVAVAARFATVLLVGAFLAVLFYRRLQTGSRAEVYQHIFHTSVPWLLLGLAVIAASLPASSGNALPTSMPSGDASVYNMLLSAGNLLLIVGQISLAWDLRRIDLENVPRLSPLWSVCAPTMVAYFLLYPDLPLPLLGICWLLVLITALLWHTLHTVPDNVPEMERYILKIEPIILWISLLMTVFGAPRHAILFYLMWAMLAVSLQLSVGALRFIHASTQDPNGGEATSVLGNIIVAFTAPLILMLIIVAMAMWFITMPGGMYLLRHYGSSGVHIGTTDFNLVKVLFILSAFYVARAVISIGSSLLRKMPEHGINIDRTMLPPIQTAFVYMVWGIFVLVVLNALGLDLKSLAVVAGGLSVGIGFGMQNIVNNFLSGLILIFSRSLQEGDVIELGSLTGKVRKINVRATTVETYDNAVIYVPNSEFVSNRIINWTNNSRSVRREIIIGVAYGTDPNLVMRLLKETADASPDVLKYPSPAVLFTDFGNSTLDFRLRFWVRDYDLGLRVSSDLRVALNRVFREHNVEIAFPQMDVHIKDLPNAARKRPPAPARPPREAGFTGAQALPATSGYMHPKGVTHGHAADNTPAPPQATSGPRHRTPLRRRPGYSAPPRRREEHNDMD